MDKNALLEELMLQATLGELPAGRRESLEAMLQERPDMRRKLDALQRTARLAGASASTPAPSGFTDRALSALPEQVRTPFFTKLLLPVFTSPPRERTLAFFFVAAAFYHLVLAFIMLFVFKGPDYSLMQGWFSLQPHICLATAVVFSGVALFLIHDGEVAIWVALTVAVIDIFFTLGNGASLQQAFRTPSTASFTYVYTLVGLLLAMFLLDAANHSRKRHACASC